VTTRIDQERVEILLGKSGLNDRQIGERIGVDQSTVWRLRNGRIAKVSRYIGLLEKQVPGATPENGFEGLEELAGQSPAFRAVLEALLQFMHEHRKSRAPSRGG
jgi:hypothetical protein